MPASKQVLGGQLIRFGTVGITNTTVDFGAFFLLVWLGTAYLPAQITAYILGTANSFLLNRFWTFQLKTRTRWEEIYRFAIINGLSLLASTAIIYVVHGLIGVDLRMAKILATAGGIVINFAGSRWWVFTDEAAIGEYNHA